MLVKMIAGVSRVCGKAQGYFGLPIRDIIVNDSVNGHVHAMQTGWEPTPAEVETLNAGGVVLITILGSTPPPMNVEVEAKA